MRPAPGEAHILIVDDEPANVLLLEHILDQAGYPNHTATTDPRQVPTIHARFDPDLILLDLAMLHKADPAEAVESYPSTRTASCRPADAPHRPCR
jgi:CheY-like chemotaxis protein